MDASEPSASSSATRPCTDSYLRSISACSFVGMIKLYPMKMNKAQAARTWTLFRTGSPDGIRTRATALRGRRARPLHNGALVTNGAGRHRARRAAQGRRYRTAWTDLTAGVPGLEPRLTGPEPVGLPITPYPMGSHDRPVP